MVTRNHKKNKGDKKMQKKKVCESKKEIKAQKNKEKQKRFRLKKKEEGKKEFRVWVNSDEEKFLREIILPRLVSLGKIHKKYTG
jgi:hypothetical protein